MQYITDVMFWVSNGLLIPVILGLIFLFVVSVLTLGSLFSARQKHNRRVKRYDPLFAQVRKEGSRALLPQLEAAAGATPFERVALELFSVPAHEREYLIAKYELELDKQMSMAKTLTKFGPILGLMGTLIPMGPALVALGTGDITSMAYNMQVAFSTTVLGMFIAGMGYLALQVQKRYNHRDLIWLDYLNEELEHEQEKA